MQGMALELSALGLRNYHSWWDLDPVSAWHARMLPESGLYCLLELSDLRQSEMVSSPIPPFTSGQMEAWEGSEVFKAAVTSPQLPGLKQEVPFWQTWWHLVLSAAQGAFWAEGQGMFVQQSKRRSCFMAGIFFLGDLHLVLG